MKAQKLYIFPHAGGSVSFYAPFSQAFSTAVKRIAVQYPGRPDRHDVTPITSIPALADDIYKMLRSSDESGRICCLLRSQHGRAGRL